MEQRAAHTNVILSLSSAVIFVAIEILYNAFFLFNSMVLYILLLVWLLLSLLSMRFTKSTLMGIIVLLGVLFSVCAGYAGTELDNSIYLLMPYQFISKALILLCFNFWCNRLYRIALFASLALAIYATTFMWFNLTWQDWESLTLLSTAILAFKFTFQFFASTSLAILLLVSLITVKHARWQVLLQLVNLLLWTVSLVFSVTFLMGSLCVHTFYAYIFAADPMLVATICTLIVLFIIFILVSALGKTLKLNRILYLTTTFYLILLSCLVLGFNLFIHLFNPYPTPALLFLAIPALLSIVAKRLSKSHKTSAFHTEDPPISTKGGLIAPHIYSYTALVLLLLDALYMLIYGNFSLMRFILDSNSFDWLSFSSLIYLSVLLVLFYIAYRQLGPTLHKGRRRALIIIAIILVALSVFEILLFTTAISFTNHFSYY